MIRHKNKQRLDTLVQQQYPHLSRNQIQSFIMQGLVLVDGKPCTKVGTTFNTSIHLTLLLDRPKYVSRAGFKLEAALDHFKIDVTGLVAMDAGISTGGFTDCLLQRGIKQVYGIDVGYGEVHESLRSDLRVTLLERTNLRHLENLPELIDLATLDLSFISVLKVLPAVSKLLKEQGSVIVLIKPQFEAERHEIARGGVVKDDAVHARVCKQVQQGFEIAGFTCHGIIESPLAGATSGNKEFLGWFSKVSS